MNDPKLAAALHGSTPEDDKRRAEGIAAAERAAERAARRAYEDRMRLMRMLGAGIDAQIGHLLLAQLVARDHALDRLDDDAFGVGAFEHLARGGHRDREADADRPRLLSLLAGAE